MNSEAVSYQTELLTELIEAGEAEGVISTTKVEQLRTRIIEANSGSEIADLWAELEHTYGVLNEENWST
ncbi:hypothetical protein [Haladaptatus sp. DYF46]|uniref:hypothetical protein n=1 Tax=Haladaptatus sp. DYF46 TaxID=2886041 RepID=UPI001E4F0D25|nr:hypothetical protein [Haladaptatus sp. DYF46]